VQGFERVLWWRQIARGETPKFAPVDRNNVLRGGVSCGIAVNGRFQAWVRPYRLPDEHIIRRTLDDAV
jgi:hypothetical protein